MSEGEIILYQTEDGQTKVEVRMEGETVWLTLNQLVELFQRDKSVISRHIKNVFEEGELLPDSVVAKYATTAADGKTYQVDYYNLDMIISVGYRVNSHRVIEAQRFDNFSKVVKSDCGTNPARFGQGCPGHPPALVFCRRLRRGRVEARRFDNFSKVVKSDCGQILPVSARDSPGIRRSWSFAVDYVEVG